jgi:hypothetical protein
MRAVSLSRSSSAASLDGCYSPRSAIAHSPIPESQSLRKRISSVLLGVKGSMLPGNNVGGYAKSKDREYKPENPVARLKLLLVSGFCNYHSLVIDSGYQDCFFPHSTHPQPLHTTHATAI